MHTYILGVSVGEIIHVYTCKLCIWVRKISGNGHLQVDHVNNVYVNINIIQYGINQKAMV